jgi:hypothetical protein
MIVARQDDEQMTNSLPENLCGFGTISPQRKKEKLCGEEIFSTLFQFLPVCHVPVIFTCYISNVKFGRSCMKKHYTALLAAFVITICLAAGMFLISANALMNKNGVPVANSPAEATATAQIKSAEQAQVQQLQDLVAQYQTRETQYQSELQTAGQDLQQARDQVRQYQQLLLALQERGYIRIDSSGQIFIR